MNYFLRSSAVTGERQGSSWKALRVKGEIFSFFKIGDTRALCTLLEGEVDATEEMRASQQRSWRKQVCQQNSWPLPRAGTCVLGSHQDEILLSCLGIMSVWKRMEGDIRMSPVVISRGYSYRWFIFLYFFWYSGFFFLNLRIFYILVKMNVIKIIVHSSWPFMLSFLRKSDYMQLISCVYSRFFQVSIY